MAKKKKILMILYALSEKTRNNDFLSERPSFDTVVLNGSIIKRLLFLRHLLTHANYSTLFVSGWDEVASIYALAKSPKEKNSIIAESSIHEYRYDALKDLIKRFALRHTKTCYVPGISHELLVRKLGFDGQVVITGGCGLLDYRKQPDYSPAKEVNRFLYVGRLVEVKNLKFLINVFNNLPDLKLTIVGFGEQEEQLRAIAKSNIVFTGAVNNKDLSAIYTQNDVFLLCSKSETWGLVIEEALNSGLPVIVSDMVGCREDLVEIGHGLVFSNNSEESLKKAIEKMCNPVVYNEFRKNISLLNFIERGRKQVESYL